MKNIFDGQHEVRGKWSTTLAIRASMSIENACND